MTDKPRVSTGHPTGGQFTTIRRPEYGMRLTEPLTELEQKRLSRALNRARNSIGNPLAEDTRQRIVALVSDPTQENWETAYATVLTPRSAHTLWQAAIKYADYSITSRPSGGNWPSVPHRQQILLALDLGTRGNI